MLNYNLYYNTFYLFFAVVAFLIAFEFDFRHKEYKRLNLVLLILSSTIFIIVFGLRDFSVGTDTELYISKFQQIHLINGLKDVGFYYLTLLTQKIANERVYLIILSCLYVVPLTLSFKLLPISNKFILFFSFFSLFFFESMGVNIIRQGIALTFLLLSFQLFTSNKNYSAFLVAIIGVCFHISVVVLILFFIISRFLLSIKYAIVVFICSSILAIMNFQLNSLFSKLPYINDLINSRFDEYLLGNVKREYEVGFRSDFFLFNFIFALIAVVFYYKSNIVEIFYEYKEILIVYLLSSSYFFLSFSIPYSDRVGIISWVLIPYLLIPFVIHKSGRFQPKSTYLVIISIVCHFLL